MAIGWLIGADRYLHYASKMLGKRPMFYIFLKICWKFIIPLATPVSLLDYAVCVLIKNVFSFSKQFVPGLENILQ